MSRTPFPSQNGVASRSSGELVVQVQLVIVHDLPETWPASLTEPLGPEAAYVEDLGKESANDWVFGSVLGLLG